MKLIIYFISFLIYSSQIDISKTLIIYLSKNLEDDEILELMVDYIKEKANINSYKVNYNIKNTELNSKFLGHSSKNQTNIIQIIKRPNESIDKYDTILLGYPFSLMNSTEIVFNSLIKFFNFSEKIIYPFTTYEDSTKNKNLNNTINPMLNLTFLKEFPKLNSDIKTIKSRYDMDKWLKETLKIIKDKKIEEINDGNITDILDTDDNFEEVKPKFKIDKDKGEAWIFAVGGGIIVLLVIIAYIVKCCRK